METKEIKQIAFPTANGTALLDSTKYVWTVNGVSPDPKTGSVYISNVDSATVLKSYRNINGTPFNGSANITTQYWGTARNIVISDYLSANTGPETSVNGSRNVVLKLPATIKANINGNCTGSSGSCTGNAVTATNANHATTADRATNATNANHATIADRATNATNANHATIADRATNATNDSSNRNIVNTYALKGNYPDRIKFAWDTTFKGYVNVTVDKTTWGLITSQNISGQSVNHATSADRATNATNATNATKAMNDGNGANIANTYIKLATPQTVTAQHNFSSGIKINGVKITVET